MIMTIWDLSSDPSPCIKSHLWQYNPNLEGGWGGDGDRQTARAVSEYQV